jgi:hypothetical protein
MDLKKQPHISGEPPHFLVFVPDQSMAYELQKGKWNQQHKPLQGGAQ